MHRYLLSSLALIFQIGGAFAAETKLLHLLGTSPDGNYSIAIRHPKDSPPTEIKRRDHIDVRMEEGSDVVATTKDGKVISSFASPQGFLTVTWNQDSDHVAIRWHVYRTHGGCELFRVERKGDITTFADVNLPEKRFLQTMAKDSEFSSDLKWMIRPFEWRGNSLRVECIPLSKGDEPHPFAQDRIWYEVEATLTEDSKFMPIALHATHGNHRGDGKLIRPNPVWRNNQAEQGGADQPATAPESKSEGKEKPKPESEVRSQ
ncbi:MAG: hypothetical protein AAGA58_12710 [Verrucomicrobiota bacterium]